MMFLIVMLALLQFTAGLNVVFEWKSLASRYPDTETGHLLQEEGVPFSLEVWHDMVFLAIPRWRAGVRASLNFVHLPKGSSNSSTLRWGAPVQHSVEPVLFSVFPTFPKLRVFPLPLLIPLTSAVPYSAPALLPALVRVLTAPALQHITLPTYCLAGDAADRSPHLRPYPSWSWHNMHTLVGNADALQTLMVSPFRARADRCNRLWVLDSGVADILGTAERIAPTRILVFHLETRHILRIAVLPKNVTTVKSFHTNFVVDAEDCESAFAYIADDGDPGLVVYDFGNDTFWRISHPYFSDNQANTLSSLALSTPVEGDPELYLQLGRLNLSTLSLKTMEMPDVDILNERSIASGASDIDKWTDTFFYTQVMQKTVGCCNMMQDCTNNTEDFINTTLYPSDVRLDQDGNLWILETYALPYNLTLPTSSGVKYRIVSAPVERVTKGLSCFNSNRKHFPNNGATRSVTVLLWIACIQLFIT